MVVKGFSDELVKLAEKDRSPSIVRGLMAGGTLGGIGGIAGLVSDPHTQALAKLNLHRETLGSVLPFLKNKYPGLVEAAEELIADPAIRKTHLMAPALAGAIAGGAYQVVKKLHHKKTASFNSWVQTPGAAMFATHVPLGGAALGALRARKGQGLSGAFKGTAGEVAGNVAGAAAGLIAARVISHAFFHGGGPSWLEPTAIAGGGLAVAPLLMHALTRGR